MKLKKRRKKPPMPRRRSCVSLWKQRSSKGRAHLEICPRPSVLSPKYLVFRGQDTSLRGSQFLNNCERCRLSALDFLWNALLERLLVPGRCFVAAKKTNKLCDLIGAFGKENAIEAEAREQSEKDR